MYTSKSHQVTTRSIGATWKQPDSHTNSDEDEGVKKESGCQHHIHIHNDAQHGSNFGACPPWDYPKTIESACEAAKCPPKHLHAPWNCSEAETGFPIVICGNVGVSYNELCRRNPVSIGRPRIHIREHIVGSATCNIDLEFIPKDYWIRCTLSPHTPTLAMAQIGNCNLPVCVREQSIVDFRLPFHVISAVCEFTVIYTSVTKRLVIHIHAIPPPQST